MVILLLFFELYNVYSLCMCISILIKKIKCIKMGQNTPSPAKKKPKHYFVFKAQIKYFLLHGVSPDFTGIFPPSIDCSSYFFLLLYLSSYSFKFLVYVNIV